MVRFFLRGLLKSINSSPSGFFLRALALGRETLRMVLVALRRRGLVALLRRAAERFTKRPRLVRCGRRRRVDRELGFLRGLINRTRLNSGICFSLVVLKMQNPSPFRFCERLQNWNVRGGYLKKLGAGAKGSEASGPLG